MEVNPGTILIVGYFTGAFVGSVLTAIAAKIHIKNHYVKRWSEES